MTFNMIVILVVGTVFVLFVALLLFKRVPRKLKVDRYVDDWKELQHYCKDKSTWPTAIIQADKLVDKALKKRKFKGKSMGERIVSAQHKLSSNDQLWFSHNLAKKLVLDQTMNLRETDVKAALIGFRQALRDLGALKTTELPGGANEAEQNER